MALRSFTDSFNDARERSERTARLRDVLGGSGEPLRRMTAEERGASPPAGAPAPNSPPPSRNPGARQSFAMAYMHGLGWSPVQSAAIVGGLVQESGSGLNPTAVGDQGTAHGIAQWRGDRFDGLKAFASERGANWRDFETQLRFIDHELRNTEIEAGRRLRAAETVEDASFAMAGYERPRGWKGWQTDPTSVHGWANRLGNARRQYGQAVAFTRGDGDLADVDVTDQTAYRRWLDGLNEAQRGAVDLVSGEAGGKVSASGLAGDVNRGGSEDSAAPTTSRGETLRDVISSGLLGFGSAQSGTEANPGDFTQGSRGLTRDFAAISQAQASGGALPGLPPLGSLREVFQL